MVTVLVVEVVSYVIVASQTVILILSIPSILPETDTFPFNAATASLDTASFSFETIVRSSEEVWMSVAVVVVSVVVSVLFFLHPNSAILKEAAKMDSRKRFLVFIT